jgi:hypothetical protein
MEIPAQSDWPEPPPEMEFVPSPDLGDDGAPDFAAPDFAAPDFAAPELQPEDSGPPIDPAIGPRNRATQSSIGQSQPAATAVSAPKFTLIELLTGAAFSGAQGGLLAIGLLSLFGTTILGGGAWLALVLLMIVAQSQRWIEGMDFGIFLGVSLLLIAAIGPLRSVLGGNLTIVLVVTLMAGAAGVAAMATFQLLYQLLQGLSDR